MTDYERKIKIENIFRRENIHMPNIVYSEEEKKFINTADGGIATHEEIKDHYDYLWRTNNQTCTPKEWDTCRVEKMRL